MGDSSPCVCHDKINTIAKQPLQVHVLLFCSAVTLFVLPYHVLNFLHSQYAFVHLDLLFREGAENNIVIFFGKLVFDDILRPEISLVSPRQETMTIPDLPSQKV